MIIIIGPLIIIGCWFLWGATGAGIACLVLAALMLWAATS